jgi:hypothetical protein
LSGNRHITPWCVSNHPGVIDGIARLRKWSVFFVNWFSRNFRTIHHIEWND